MTAADVIRQRAELLASQAARLGVVLTVEQRPLQPLAMGHYTTEVSVRVARLRDKPRRPFDLDDACRAAMERLTAYIDEAVYEAREDQAVEGALARMAMEERHHGPRGAGGGGGWPGVRYQPIPGERIFFSVGGAAAGGCSVRGVGPRGYGFWCASCQQSNQHLRGCSNVQPGEPVVGGPL